MDSIDVAIVVNTYVLLRLETDNFLDLFFIKFVDTSI